MSKIFSVPVAWLVARPCASHAVVSGLEAYVLGTVFSLLLALVAHVGHVDLGLLGHAGPIVAAGLISAVYYGREAGQLEHDLKHGTTSHGVQTPFMAFVGAEFMGMWGKDNFAQWLSAAGATAAVAVLLTFV